MVSRYKNLFLLLVICGILINSCERDDICVEAVTPKLIIRFYDPDNPTETKAVNSLNVWVTGKDTLVNNQTTDSIAVPLDVNSLSTVYNFRNEANVVDTLTINYLLEELFASRSCGFIVNYKEVSITNTRNWIQNIEVVSPTIENENQAHVQIRH